ncbi:MAG TPA: rhodanese-like domain-containing protein [Prosthecobacter sp.]
MMASLVQAAVLVAVAAAAAVLTQQWHPRAPALYLSEAPLAKDEIGLKQVQERWQGNVLWLDARPEDVYQKAHIPGAKLLNEQKFGEQLIELLDVLQTTKLPVVIYCGGEKCEASRTVREKLLSVVPLEECYVLKGGWPAWQAAQP